MMKKLMSLILAHFGRIGSISLRAEEHALKAFREFGLMLFLVGAGVEGGVELGFRAEEAARIVEHTVHGAASLLLQSGMHPEVAIDQVTTAGGITIKGLNVMERSGFTAAVINGLNASR